MLASRWRQIEDQPITDRNHLIHLQVVSLRSGIDNRKWASTGSGPLTVQPYSIQTAAVRPIRTEHGKNQDQHQVWIIFLLTIITSKIKMILISTMIQIFKELF